MKFITPSSRVYIGDWVKMKFNSFSVEGLFPPSWPEIRAVMDEVALRARSVGVPADDLDDFLLAMNEALANAVKHGCPDPTCLVWLRCGIDVGRALWARVRDQGNGFDPSRVPNPQTLERIHRPGGRGLLMIRALCDEVRWLHGGTEVHLVKYLSAGSSCPASHPAGHNRQ